MYVCAYVSMYCETYYIITYIGFPLIVTGGKRKREEVDSDLSEEHVLRNSDNISPTLQKKQKGNCYIGTWVLNYLMI